MKIIIRFVCLTFGFSIAAARLYASAGAASLQSLTLRSASRAESLGGALTASGDDLSSLAINPATLSGMRYPEAMFTQALLFEDIKFSYLGYAQPTRWGTFAKEYMALSYGEFDSVSRDGSISGTQSPKETIFGFGWTTNRYQRSETGEYSEYRKGTLKNIDAGFNLRYFKSDLGSDSASALSMNFGALYKTPVAGLSLGLAVNNLGSSVKYAGESNSQPQIYRLGTSYSTNEFMALASKARFSIDGVLPKDGGFHMAMGAELLFGSMFSLQAGYAGEENLDKRLRFGMGMGFDAVHLNYSAAPMGDLGTAHRITARLRFGSGVWNIMSVLSGEQAVMEDIRAANQYIVKGDSKRAALYANRVLRKQPDNFDAREILKSIEDSERAKLGSQIYSEVVALIRLGLFQEAEDKIKQCLEIDPGNKSYQSIHENISAQLASSKLSETDKLLAKIRENQARETQPVVPQAQQIAPGQNLTAFPAVAIPVSQDLDTESRSEFNKASSLLQEHKLDEAIGTLRMVAERNRKNDEVISSLSNCLKGRGVKSFAKGRYEESYTDFKEASSLNPADPSLKKFLANVEQIMESLNLKPTVASYAKSKK